MKDTGGPAFPVLKQHNNGYVSQVAEGMTLRDWFAGMAMQGLIQVQIATRQPQSAETAYQWADAMIQERSKT